MIVLNPDQVRFKGKTLGGVGSVWVDRVGTREVVKWSDMGPHVVLADVPEQRVTVRVIRDVGAGELVGPAPGEMGTLSFLASATAGDGRRYRVHAECVVLGVTHRIETGRRAMQTVSLIAVSGDGAEDPLTVEAE